MLPQNHSSMMVCQQKVGALRVRSWIIPQATTPRIVAANSQQFHFSFPGGSLPGIVQGNDNGRSGEIKQRRGDLAADGTAGSACISLIQKYGADDKRMTMNRKETAMLVSSRRFWPCWSEKHLFRSGHKHEPLKGHDAHENIICQVQQHRKPACKLAAPAEHRGPESVGNKIQDKGNTERRNQICFSCFVLWRRL